MTILDQLADYAKYRVEQAKAAIPLEEVRRLAELRYKEDSANPVGKAEPFRFEKALRGDDITFICECKKASPSKGLIAPDFPYLQIAKEYEAAGADCISVLTEPKWFLGSDAYLKEITEAVATPCIRKDFTVDPYMIYEAKNLGAAAVLLIVSILDKGQLTEYKAICDALGLSALVECHDETEIETALSIGAKIIGVNNRNLKNFTVDTGNSKRLRSLVPEDIIFVAESGVKTAEDIKALREASVNAVLIGETLMRAADKKQMLMTLKGE